MGWKTSTRVKNPQKFMENPHFRRKATKEMVPGEKPSSIKYRENSTSYLSSRAQWPHLVNVWQGWNPRIFYRLVKGRVGGENPRRKPPGSPTENIFGTPSTSDIPTPPPRRNPCSKLLDYTARPRAEQNSTSVQSSKRPQAEEVLLSELQLRWLLGDLAA